MEEPTPWLDALVLAWARSQPQAIKGIEATASQVLGGEEMKVLNSILHPEQGAHRNPLKIDSYEEAALKKLIHHFHSQKMGQSSPIPLKSAYTLAELYQHCLGDGSMQQDDRYPCEKQLSAYLLRKDLACFANTIIGRQAKGVAKRNLNRLLHHLYESELTVNGVLSAKIIRVVDLYCLNEKALDRFAYEKARVPCGRKTLDALEETLRSVSLPGIKQVVRPYEDYTQVRIVQKR